MSMLTLLSPFRRRRDGEAAVKIDPDAYDSVFWFIKLESIKIDIIGWRYIIIYI